jgi:sugar lactone lactonase YvrE
MKPNCFSRLAVIIFLLVLRSAPAATFTLGSSALLEGPTAGSDSILLAASPNNSAWTASTNNLWLHLSAANQSGGFSTNVIFSFDANAGLTRTGSLTIAGQTLSIVQAGAAYVAAKGAMPLIISSGLHFPYGLAVNAAGNAFIADSFNNAIKKWTLTNNSVSTLISSGLNHPNGIAADAAGNLYIADTGNNAIKKWNVTNSTVSTVITGLSGPLSVAVDGAGNLFILETTIPALKRWTAANSNLTTIISSGLSGPTGLAVDAAGNAYVADELNTEIYKWNAASGTVTTLISFSQGLDPVAPVADGSGNLWFTDGISYTLRKWVAASNVVVTVASTGSAPSSIDGLALDSSGNFYMTDYASNTVKVLQLAFVDTTTKNETAAAGTDALPPVLPTTQNFLPPFAPTSDQAWLTISGVTNGAVNFAFTATTSNRVAHLNLLGKSITVTQSNSVVVTPPVLLNPKFLAGGSFQFAFSNNQGATFSVVATTNLLVPLANWNVVGIATNTAPGLYQFAIPATNTEPRKFFRVRAP